MSKKKATPPKEVIVNGQSFDSITKAAFALGVRRTEISKRIKQGGSTKLYLSPNSVISPKEQVKLHKPLRRKFAKPDAPSKEQKAKAKNRKNSKPKR